MKLSTKQFYGIKLGERPFDWHHFIGSVRAGKSMSGLLAFLIWAIKFNRSRHGQDYIIMAKNKLQLRGFIATELKDFSNLLGLRFRHDQRNSKIIIGLNTFHLCDASDARAFERFQGITVYGIYYDELPNLAREVVLEGFRRVSPDVGAKYVSTGNPDHPYHWVKLEFIDKCDDTNAEVIHFYPGDNPSDKPKIGEGYYQRQWNMHSEYERKRIFECMIVTINWLVHTLIHHLLVPKKHC